MTRKISQMRSLGPAMERWLAEVDIHNENDLRAIGAVPAYQRLKFRFGTNINLLALYAMYAALADIDWREVDDATKQRLRSQLR